MEVLKKERAKFRSPEVSSQYKNGRKRGLVDVEVVSYMTNQRQSERVLRVDRRFRTHWLEEGRVNIILIR